MTSKSFYEYRNGKLESVAHDPRPMASIEDQVRAGVLHDGGNSFDRKRPISLSSLIIYVMLVAMAIGMIWLCGRGSLPLSMTILLIGGLALAAWCESMTTYNSEN